MNSQELKTVERELEAQGIDLHEGGLTREEFATIMVVVDDAAVEPKSTDRFESVWISEDQFLTVLELAQDVAPKLVFPLVLHFGTENEKEELFLNPLLLHYLTQQAEREAVSLDYNQITNGMPKEYLLKMEELGVVENLATPALDPAQYGLDGL